MADGKACVICGGVTEIGFVMDHGHFDVRRQEEWWEGRPERAFWSGLRKPIRTFKIKTLRCTKCGYLMDFAESAEASGG